LPAAGLTCLLHLRIHLWQEFNNITLFAGSLTFFIMPVLH